MSYSYGYGAAARIAMQAYLATAGRDKIGFSITGKGDDGKPVYIDGVRGVVERNTMRYYLAIEAYLGALSATPCGSAREAAAGLVRSRPSAIPQQLHEIERDDYLKMKRNELQRQKAGGVK